MKHFNRVKEIRESRGLSQDQLAQKINTSRGQIFQLEKGLRKLSLDWMVRLAEALHCEPEDFIRAPEPPSVPVLGFVGAGEEVLPIDDLPLTRGFTESEQPNVNCEFVEAPPGVHRDIIALKVRGDSMEPFMPEGTIVYYNNIRIGNFDEYLGKLVVAKLKDGRVYLKKLKRGTAPNKYRLVSYNAVEIEDVQLEWCGRVIFVKMD